VNTGRKDRKISMEIKKPYAVFQYNKFIKGRDRADQYISYYSFLRKTVKWSKKVVLYLLNCALFSVYRTLNTNRKVKCKNFLHEVGRSRISEVQNRSESRQTTFGCQRSQQHRGILNTTCQADSLRISEYTN